MIKKIVLVLCVLFVYVSGIAQPVTARSSSVVTVMDSRFFAQYNFRPPVFPDTTAANVQKGLDSCGALIFTYDYNGYWYRACSPKRWVKVGASLAGDTAYVSSRQLTPNTFVLCRGDGRCDTISIGTQGVTRLVSGSAVWTSGLNYDVTNCVYYILGTLYNSLATTVTLDPADPTDPRIDVIYLDTLGQVGVLTGNPSPNPIKPVVNPISQIELTHIYLNAGSVSPPNVYNRLVYNEGVGVPTEWDIPVVSEIIDYYYTPNPYIGSVSAYNPQSGIDNEYQFTNNTTVSADTISFLTFYLRLNGAMTHAGKVSFGVTLDNTITSESSNFLFINDGSYGFNENTIGAYQLISIPMSDFLFPSGEISTIISTEFDRIRIYVGDEIINGCQIDYVNLQSGSAVPPVTSNYWSLSGNDVSSVISPKLGTTSNNSLSIVTNDIERVNISDTGLVKITNLQTNTSQDTTTYKPVGVNSAGEITKMDSWVGSSQTPTLQQVTDAGNTTITPINITSNIEDGIGQTTKIHLSDTSAIYGALSVVNLNASTSVYEPLNMGLTVYPNNNNNNYFYNSGITNSSIYGTIGGFVSQDNSNISQLNVANLYFSNSIGRGINTIPLYPADTIHNCYLPLTTPTQLTDTIATLRDVRAGGGSGGSGTVTSISQGYGISNSPNPITTTGTISVDTATLSGKYLRIVDTTNKWVSSVTKTNDSTIRVVKDGTTTDISITTATNATRLITQVWNSTGATITKGSVIYINGAHSSILPSIALAKANAESTSAYTYGLVVNDIADNSEGTVIQNGAITNLNLPTSSYTDGQTLYLSPTIAGGYTTTKPLAPNHYVAIGTITRAHPVFGTIQVAIRNGFQLDEMSDVSIPTTPADSTLLQFSRVDSLWHAVSPTNAIGNNYIKPSDTATMLTNYPRGSGIADRLPYWTTSRTLTAAQNYIISSTLTNPSIQVSNSAFTSKGIVTPISVYASKNSINYAGGFVDTANNLPYLLAYNGTANKSSKFYPTKLTFSNLSNGSAVEVVAPSSTSNRTINIQDASGTLMLQGDTVSLSNRINLKANLSQGTYSFLANNTNATANMASTPFKDVNGSYTGTPTWTGGTAPTGLTNATYQYTQIGKQVTLRIHLQYTGAGTSNTRVQIPFIADFPTPIVPTGLTSTSDILYFGTGAFSNNKTTLAAAIGTQLVYIRGTATGNEIVIDRGAGTGQYVWATIQYFTNTTY